MSFAQGLLVFLTVIADIIIVWVFLWATDLRRGDKKK
jgi:nitrogen fixation-related uncharacterized protein